MTARTSLSNAGDGVEDPENVSVYRAWEEGKQVALVLEWEGEQYDRGRCWIQASEESYRDLESIR